MITTGARASACSHANWHAPESSTKALARELPNGVAGFPTHFGPTEEAGIGADDAGHDAARSTTAPRSSCCAITCSHVARRSIHSTGSTPPIGSSRRPKRLGAGPAGEMFDDSIGELTRLRELLAWYPDDVWLFVMAGHWASDRQSSSTSTGVRASETTRLARAYSRRRSSARSCGLVSAAGARYPPYSKWLGSAYAAAAPTGDQRAGNRTPRERLACARGRACRGFRAPCAPSQRAWRDRAGRSGRRPVLGSSDSRIGGDRFDKALRAAISDADLRAIENRCRSIDSVADNATVLTWPTAWRRLPAYTIGRLM